MRRRGIWRRCDTLSALTVPAPVHPFLPRRTTIPQCNALRCPVRVVLQGIRRACQRVYSPKSDGIGKTPPASLTTLAFLATNSNSVLANGDLGLQQVPNPCACRLSRFCRTHATRGNQVLLAVLVAGVLIRLGLAALGVTALDFDAFSVVGFFLFWHCVLLL